MLALRAELDKLTAGIFLILPCRAVLYSVTQLALVDAFDVSLASLKQKQTIINMIFRLFNDRRDIEWTESLLQYIGDDYLISADPPRHCREISPTRKKSIYNHEKSLIKCKNNKQINLAILISPSKTVHCGQCTLYTVPTECVVCNTSREHFNDI